MQIRFCLDLQTSKMQIYCINLYDVWGKTERMSENRQLEQEDRRMIKVKARVNYGFAGTDMTFEEEFEDGTPDSEIEEVMKDMVMEQVDWSWEKEY